MPAELYIYGGAFGLPSIDPQCLALISYMSIVSHQEFSIIECNDAGFSPTGELPMLHDGKNWIAGANRIIAYLAKTGYNVNEHLSAEENAHSVAYASLVDENLMDALIYDHVRDCYKVLDRKLGENDFFFGVRPTTLDAKVFGYLALQLYPEIPNPRFQMILTSQFPRLVAYCNRCRDEFFANLPSASAPIEASPFFSNPFSAPKEWFRSTFFGPSSTAQSIPEKPKRTAEERDFDVKRVYAIAFGVIAMAAYVIVNGLVVIGNEEEDEEGHFISATDAIPGLDDLNVFTEEYDN
ncbi:metaxin 1 [Podila horticola]|nr:metaxin 1 [Podila horticola]